ncbi:MAG: sugar phosphate isomerase/epimerase [Clostridia bacterium]|nr:sugar phosphate isomerase/epimerase [Clostridia bacterium]
MKIGIEKLFNDTFTRWEDEQYEKLRGYGFECLDIGFSNTDDWAYAEDEDVVIKKLAYERTLIENAGMSVSQVHGPWRFPPCDLEDADRAERMAKMKKCVHLCAAIGGKNMVIHPLMPFGLEDKNTENEAKTWDINVRFMTELATYAKAEGVNVCIENMPFKEFAISTPAEIIKIVNLVNLDNFKICFDTGHANLFKELKLGDCVRELGDMLAVLHVHDNNGIGDHHLPPYYGVANWKDFGRALKEISFKGAVSLECLPPKKISDEALDSLTKAYAQLAKDIVE